MKSFLIVLVIAISLFSISDSTYALEVKQLNQVNANQFITETQVLAPCDPDHVNFIWWIPIEYWKIVYAQDDSLTEAGEEKIINYLEPYSILAIFQADISVFGVFDYYVKEEVEKMLEVIFRSEDGSSSNINIAKEIDPNVNMLLDMFTPMLGAAMGNMGENVHFFVLENHSAKGERLINTYNFGSIDFSLGTRNSKLLNTQIKLPVDALYIPRICPNGEEAHVSWKYSPWTGQRLPDQKSIHCIDLYNR